MKTIEVVAAIIMDNGKILATQRGSGNYKDKWEFPGGKIEPGEMPEEALVREIKEELDALISVNDFLCSVDYDYPDFHLKMHCFIFSIINGKLVLKEHEAARWLGKNELQSIDWLPADIEVIRELERLG